MKHPFDDFLPVEVHNQREDKRVIKIFCILFSIGLMVTVSAFSKTLSIWNTLMENRESISMRWEDANLRASTYLTAENNTEQSVLNAENLAKFVDGVPRSIIMWEVSQRLPTDSVLSELKLETRQRQLQDSSEEVKEIITVIGTALSDTDITSYINRLSLSNYFSSIKLLFSQQDGKTTNRIFSIQLITNPNSVLDKGEKG